MGTSRRVGLATVLLASLLGTAHAFEGTANEIDVQNGLIGIIDPLIVAKGGTGRATITAEAVLVGDGTNPVQMETASADGQVFRRAAGVVAFGSIDLADSDAVGATVLGFANGGTGLSATPAAHTFIVGTGAAWEATAATPDCIGASDALTYNQTTRDFGCHAISAASSVLAFGTQMDVTGGTTVHVGVGTGIGPTQTKAQTRAAVAMTLDNLRCVSTANPGGSDTITVTMATGTCTSALTDSTTQICTITSATRLCQEAGAGQAVAQGDCYAFKVVPTATAATNVVNCNIERTS